MEPVTTRERGCLLLLSIMIVLYIPAVPCPAMLLHPVTAEQPRANHSMWSWVAVYHGGVVDPRLAKQWTAQVMQDRVIVDLYATYAPKRHGGYFVDLASNDAVHWSNTLTLEQHFGWSGLCIEANPKYAADYASRTCQLIQAAVGAIENEALQFDFRERGKMNGGFDNGALGGIVGFENPASAFSVTRYTVSLRKLLTDFHAPAIIDYLSLDIEGAEFYALEHFPFDKYTFRVMTAERPSKPLQEIFVMNGYTHLCNCGGFGDMLWMHHSFPNFEKVATRFSKSAADPSSIQCSKVLDVHGADEKEVP